MSATDDDALYILTAAMLTPSQFPSVLADDYPQACAVLSLEPDREGYGLVFGQDGSGARWTVAVTDTALVACALAAWDCGLEYDLSPDERYVAAALPGWPLPVAVAAPGIPAPHDPSEEEGGRAPLTPPDTASWGPAQRRLGADEIALHWRQWRDSLDTDSDGPAPDGAASSDGDPGTLADADSDTDADTGADTDAAADAEAAGTTDDADTGTDGRPGIRHEGVRHALDEAEAYVRNPPPPGRIRMASGAIRADGPGWSLVARTDDMAFILLDDEPGAVLPVARGSHLPVLLEALDKLAERPG